MRKVFLFFFIIFFFAMGGIFVFEAAITNDLVLLIPGTIGFISAILLIMLLCKKRLEYHVLDEELVVKNDGKIVQCFKKEDICSLKYVCDAFDESLYMIRFSVKGKHYNIVPTPENKNDILTFFKDTAKTVSRNRLYHFVVFLSDLIK